MLTEEREEFIRRHATGCKMTRECLVEIDRLRERCRVLEAEVDAWRDCPHDHFAKVWDQPQMSGRHRSEPRQRIIDAMYATDAERSKA